MAEIAVTEQLEVLRYRKITGIFKIVVALCSIVAIGASVFHIFHFSIFDKTFVDIGYYFFLIAFFLPLVFIFLPFSKRAEHQRITWFDVVFYLLYFLVV